MERIATRQSDRHTRLCDGTFVDLGAPETELRTVIDFALKGAQDITVVMQLAAEYEDGASGSQQHGLWCLSARIETVRVVWEEIERRREQEREVERSSVDASVAAKEMNRPDYFGGSLV